ncbi:hypothetical protein [Streptomyces cyslabdanicus]|uniref:hypothetical protein n=1 Tax=Streptomyces cyslabdanicus TaxID=1470456 RepID=UPI004043F617
MSHHYGLGAAWNLAPRAGVELGYRMEAFYARAASLGFDRGDADLALREAQGRQAGSSPSQAECDAAIAQLCAGQ